MRNLCAAICAALFAVFAVSSADAQDVTLISPNGQVEISGDLLGFDGEFYRISTVYGELTVDGSGVRCEGPGCPDLINFVARFRISGEAMMGAVLMPAMLDSFAAQNGLRGERVDGDGPGFVYQLREIGGGDVVAEISFRVSTTDEGFADLLADEADLVLSLREIREDERQMARGAGLGDLTAAGRSRVVALDAAVPVVAPGNPLTRISPRDLANIFAGNITNWSALGGPDAPISLHLPEVGSGLGQSIEDRLIKPAKLRFAQDIVRHSGSRTVSGAVESDPFAIGIVSYAETGNARVLTLSGECGFSLGATRRNIKAEDYPLTSPMFLYLPARRLPKIGRDFLRYMRGASAQLVIRRAGFVDQTPEEIGINLQGRRFTNAISAAGAEITLQELQRMTRTLAPMKRLTTTFRFESGSIRLDAQSRSNVEQLAIALELGRYDARRLLFVGFSDGEGPADMNRSIALRRAEAVRRSVITASTALDVSRVELDVDAFGEALPMACDDSPWGKKANRRVEVWVR